MAQERRNFVLVSLVVFADLNMRLANVNSFAIDAQQQIRVRPDLNQCTKMKLSYF